MSFYNIFLFICLFSCFVNRQQTKPPIFQSVSDNLILQMFFGFCFGNIKVLPLRLQRNSIQIWKYKHLFIVVNVPLSLISVGMAKTWSSPDVCCCCIPVDAHKQIIYVWSVIIQNKFVSGVSQSTEIKNTRSLISHLNNISPTYRTGNGVGLQGVIRSSQEIPYDSAIFMSTNSIPSDGELLDMSILSLIKKRIRVSVKQLNVFKITIT